MVDVFKNKMMVKSGCKQHPRYSNNNKKKRVDRSEKQETTKPSKQRNSQNPYGYDRG